MSNFKYLKISEFTKLRYLSINQNSNFYIVFLHGFMSDIEGDKPKNFLKYCKKRKMGFLAIEYSGHGKSSGKFTKCNISRWTEDVKFAELIGNQVETGTFFMNRCDYLDPALSWTGVKETGKGCSLSEIAYEHLTAPKSFHLRKEQ